MFLFQKSNNRIQKAINGFFFNIVCEVLNSQIGSLWSNIIIDEWKSTCYFNSYSKLMVNWPKTNSNFLLWTIRIKISVMWSWYCVYTYSVAMETGISGRDASQTVPAAAIVVRRHPWKMWRGRGRRKLLLTHQISSPAKDRYYVFIIYLRKA